MRSTLAGGSVPRLDEGRYMVWEVQGPIRQPARRQSMCGGRKRPTRVKAQLEFKARVADAPVAHPPGLALEFGRRTLLQVPRWRIEVAAAAARDCGRVREVPSEPATEVQDDVVRVA